MYIYLINQTPNPTSPHSAHLIRRHSPPQPPPISLLADLIEDISRPHISKPASQYVVFISDTYSSNMN